MSLYRITSVPFSNNLGAFKYPIRPRSKVFTKVSKKRLGVEITSIAKLGGKILNIEALPETRENENNSMSFSQQVSQDQIKVSSEQKSEQSNSQIRVESFPNSKEREKSKVKVEQTTLTNQPELILGWWLEIFAKFPKSTTYFGPFESIDKALSSRNQSLKKFLNEGAKDISIQIKYCQPRQLRIVD